MTLCLKQHVLLSLNVPPSFNSMRESPVYLHELCCPLLSAKSLRSLHSSQQGLLVPFARICTRQIHTFFMEGPSTGLHTELCIFNRTLSPESFFTLRLLFLTVLILGVLLSSFLVQYEWMNLLIGLKARGSLPIETLPSCLSSVCPLTNAVYFVMFDTI